MSHSDNIIYRLFTDHERLRMVLFLFFAFCILAVSLAFFALSMGKPYMGISLSMGDRGWTIERVDPNGLASRVGMREGDRPIEINGQPAQTFLEKYRESGLVFSMLLRELSVIDDNGQLKSATLKDSSPSWQSVIDQTARFAASLIFGRNLFTLNRSGIWRSL